MTGDRSSGLLEADLAYGCSDHAGAGYASDEERCALAASWLRDGLEAGQRAVYIGEAPEDRLVDREHDDLAAARDAGAFVLVTTDEVYDLARPIDPDEQLAAYDALVTQALDAGYVGVRVVADITPLVTDSARQAAHLRWEQIGDRYLATRPLAPLCLLDTRRVRFDAVVHVHPLRDAAHTDFGVYGAGPDVTTIEGEVDALAADVFALVLQSVPSTDVLLDLSPLAFLDGRAAWCLQAELGRRREHGQALAVVGVPPFLHRLWDLCRFDPGLLAGSLADARGGGG